jgi:hypothetical protein
LGSESFKKTAGDILRALRASALAPGAERIYTAGEKEYLAWLERKEKGVPSGKPCRRNSSSCGTVLTCHTGFRSNNLLNGRTGFRSNGQPNGCTGFHDQLNGFNR